MRFLIAGFGSTGRRHLRNLQALGQKDILLYRTHQSTLPDDELDGMTVETDLQAALSHRPDVVIVSNPTSLHLDVAIPAAEAGCTIFMEKPISHSMDRVDELCAALARGNGRFVTGFQFRHHPTLQQIRHWLELGDIGQPVSVRAHWGEYLPAWHPWEDYRNSYSARSNLGGGVVLTLSHPFDYLRWLLGEISRLSAFTGRLSGLELDVEDTAEINLQFENGVTGSVHLNYVQQPPIHRLEIVGQEGSVIWTNANGAARLYRMETDDWETVLPPVGFDRNDLFMAEMRNLIDVAAGRAEPAASLEDGVKALEISLAVLQSGQEGRTIELQQGGQNNGSGLE